MGPNGSHVHVIQMLDTFGSRVEVPDWVITIWDQYGSNMCTMGKKSIINLAKCQKKKKGQEIT